MPTPLKDRLYISTVAVQGQRHLPTILERLAALGITRIELSAPHPHIPEPELIELLNSWRPTLSFVLHNYFPCPKLDFVLNLATENAQTREQCASLVSSAFQVANAVGSPVYGVHSGYLADADATPDGKFSFRRDRVGTPDDCVMRSVAFVKDMLVHHVPPSEGLLLENLFPSETGENFSLACTPAEIEALFTLVNDDRVSLLLDLSHFELTCNIFGLPHDKALDDLIDRMGEKIRAIHMSANDGRRDVHFPLRKDGWPLAALRRLRSLPTNPIVTLESRRLDDELILRQRDLLFEMFA